jgi:hypothetical protein
MVGDCEGRECNSPSNDLIHRSSEDVTTKLQCSASAEDRDTVVCFFEDQEIRLGPKKMVNPVVDLLSLEHSVQSASQYA